MGENFLTPSRIGWLAGVAVLVMVANVIASILYMVVYSYLIDPGHDPDHYNAHIQVAAPYCSIVAGVPLMFLAGGWVGGWWRRDYAMKSGIAVWLVYVSIDFTVIILAGGFTPQMTMLFAVSFLTKLAAIYFGVRLAQTR